MKTPNGEEFQICDMYKGKDTVNKEGQHTKLDESCIRVSSNGSTAEKIGEENEHTFPYANLEVTPRACLQSFSLYGREVTANQRLAKENKLKDLLAAIASHLNAKEHY